KRFLGGGRLLHRGRGRSWRCLRRRGFRGRRLRHHRCGRWILRSRGNGRFRRRLIRKLEHVRHCNRPGDTEHDPDEDPAEPQRGEYRPPAFVLEALLVVLEIVLWTPGFGHARHLSIDVGISMFSERTRVKTMSPTRASATPRVSLVSIMTATRPTRGGCRPKRAM